MKVVSVNVGAPRSVTIGRKEMLTSIYKEAVQGRVWARRLNLDGDSQSNLKVHGGEAMAIYAYPVEHYDFWRRELDREEMPWGQFGENLSLSGLTEADVRVGEIYRFGQALLQVTQPRIPCSKLVHRMQAGPQFAKQFLHSRRLGYYLRVLEEGEIGAGDNIERVEPAPDSVSLAEFIDTTQFQRTDAAALRRALASRDLSSGPKGWREHLERMLEKAEATSN